MDDVLGVLESAMRRAAQNEVDAIERMCEVMLTTPNSPGISVHCEMKDLSYSTTVRLDPDVPFGEIRYHRSH